MTENRKSIDWDGLEPHYRAGIRSLKDIGTEFEVSDAAIIKHAKKHGWTRNLMAKIQAKADAKVSAALVGDEVKTRTKPTEALRIEVESEVQARIRLSHRRDIAKGRSIVASMFSELETEGKNISDIEKEIELETVGERDAKKRSAMLRAVELPSRATTLASLTGSLRTLISLERQAFGLEALAASEGNLPPRAELTDEDRARALAAFLAKTRQLAKSSENVVGVRPSRLPKSNNPILTDKRLSPG